MPTGIKFLPQDSSRQNAIELYLTASLNEIHKTFLNLVAKVEHVRSWFGPALSNFGAANGGALRPISALHEEYVDKLAEIRADISTWLTFSDLALLDAMPEKALNAICDAHLDTARTTLLTNVLDELNTAAEFSKLSFERREVSSISPSKLPVGTIYPAMKEFQPQRTTSPVVKNSLDNFRPQSNIKPRGLIPLLSKPMVDPNASSHQSETPTKTQKLSEPSSSLNNFCDITDKNKSHASEASQSKTPSVHQNLTPTAVTTEQSDIAGHRPHSTVNKYLIGVSKAHLPAAPVESTHNTPPYSYAHYKTPDIVPINQVNAYSQQQHVFDRVTHHNASRIQSTTPTLDLFMHQSQGAVMSKAQNITPNTVPNFRANLTTNSPSISRAENIAQQMFVQQAVPAVTQPINYTTEKPTSQADPPHLLTGSPEADSEANRPPAAILQQQLEINLARYSEHVLSQMRETEKRGKQTSNGVARNPYVGATGLETLIKREANFLIYSMTYLRGRLLLGLRVNSSITELLDKVLKFVSDRQISLSSVNLSALDDLATSQSSFSQIPAANVAIPHRPVQTDAYISQSSASQILNFQGPKATSASAVVISDLDSTLNNTSFDMSCQRYMALARLPLGSVIPPHIITAIKKLKPVPVKGLLENIAQGSQVAPVVVQLEKIEHHHTISRLVMLQRQFASLFNGVRFVTPLDVQKDLMEEPDMGERTEQVIGRLLSLLFNQKIHRYQEHLTRVNLLGKFHREVLSAHERKAWPTEYKVSKGFLNVSFADRLRMITTIMGSALQRSERIRNLALNARRHLMKLGISPTEYLAKIGENIDLSKSRAGVGPVIRIPKMLLPEPTEIIKVTTPKLPVVFSDHIFSSSESDDHHKQELPEEEREIESANENVNHLEEVQEISPLVTASENELTDFLGTDIQPFHKDVDGRIFWMIQNNHPGGDFQIFREDLSYTIAPNWKCLANSVEDLQAIIAFRLQENVTNTPSMILFRKRLQDILSVVEENIPHKAKLDEKEAEERAVFQKLREEEQARIDEEKEEESELEEQRKRRLLQDEKNARLQRKLVKNRAARRQKRLVLLYGGDEGANVGEYDSVKETSDEVDSKSEAGSLEEIGRFPFAEAAKGSEEESLDPDFHVSKADRMASRRQKKISESVGNSNKISRSTRRSIQPVSRKRGRQRLKEEIIPLQRVGRLRKTSLLDARRNPISVAAPKRGLPWRLRNTSPTLVSNEPILIVSSDDNDNHGNSDLNQDVTNKEVNELEMLKFKDATDQVRYSHSDESGDSAQDRNLSINEGVDEPGLVNLISSEDENALIDSIKREVLSRKKASNIYSDNDNDDSLIKVRGRSGSVSSSAVDSEASSADNSSEDAVTAKQNGKPVLPDSSSDSSREEGAPCKSNGQPVLVDGSSEDSSGEDAASIPKSNPVLADAFSSDSSEYETASRAKGQPVLVDSSSEVSSDEEVTKMPKGRPVLADISSSDSSDEEDASRKPKGRPYLADFSSDSSEEEVAFRPKIKLVLSNDWSDDSSEDSSDKEDTKNFNGRPVVINVSSDEEVVSKSKGKLVLADSPSNDSSDEEVTKNLGGKKTIATKKMSPAIEPIKRKIRPRVTSALKFSETILDEVLLSDDVREMKPGDYPGRRSNNAESTINDGNTRSSSLKSGKMRLGKKVSLQKSQFTPKKRTHPTFSSLSAEEQNTKKRRLAEPLSPKRNISPARVEPMILAAKKRTDLSRQVSSDMSQTSTTPVTTFKHDEHTKAKPSTTKLETSGQKRNSASSSLYSFARSTSPFSTSHSRPEVSSIGPTAIKSGTKVSPANSVRKQYQSPLLAGQGKPQPHNDRQPVIETETFVPAVAPSDHDTYLVKPTGRFKGLRMNRGNESETLNKIPGKRRSEAASKEPRSSDFKRRTRMRSQQGAKSDSESNEIDISSSSGLETDEMAETKAKTAAKHGPGKAIKEVDRYVSKTTTSTTRANIDSDSDTIGSRRHSGRLARTAVLSTSRNIRRSLRGEAAPVLIPQTVEVAVAGGDVVEISSSSDEE